MFRPLEVLIMTSLYTFMLFQNFFIVEKAEKNKLYPLRSKRLCGEYNIH